MKSRSCPGCLLPSAPASCYLTASAELVDLLDEVVHVILLDDARGDENLLGGGAHRGVAALNLRYRLHRLVAELVGLLDDWRLSRRVLDGVQRLDSLVDRHDPELAGLAGVL